MTINFQDAKLLKMHTRMREICLSIMKEAAEDIRTLDERYEWMRKYPLLAPNVEEWKEFDLKYQLRTIKRWGQWSLEHKQKIDKIKGIG